MIDEWVDGWIDELMYEWIDGLEDVLIDGWMVGFMDCGSIDGLINQLVDG